MKKDTLVFDGDFCTSNALDYLLKIKGDERKVKTENVDYNLQSHVHNVSRFQTWIFIKKPSL